MCNSKTSTESHNTSSNPDSNDWPDCSDVGKDVGLNWPDCSEVGKDAGLNWPDMCDVGRDVGLQIPPVG